MSTSTLSNTTDRDDATQDTPAIMYAQVAVPVPLDGVFDYSLPAGSIANRDIFSGCRVEVSFGKRQLIGVVVGFTTDTQVAASRLRSINRIVDTQPCLDARTLALLSWCARYYHHPVGEVINAALTSRLRIGKEACVVADPVWRLAYNDIESIMESLKRAPRQVQLAGLLAKHGSLRAEQLNALSHNWRAPLQAMVDKELVIRESASPLHEASAAVTGPEMSEQQQLVFDAVSAELNTHAVHLLHGITGSGKTEVYIRLAQRCIDEGRQVLLLVPEISLTPQLTQRFRERLNVATGILHSGLNDTQRHNIWTTAASGECRMVIGTRSAVFTPMPDLGLIILDEEHDSSFKQQEGFRYHARDVALVRARDESLPVIAGSATPSLESLHNARQGRYRYHRLTERAASKHKTSTSLIDMRRQPVTDGISDQLFTDIARHLDQGNQVMLFLNRRGFSPLLMCHDCGWTTNCKRCDAHMTYHQHRDWLRCHHCGHEMPAPPACPECGSDDLIALGTGTERIEQALADRFGSEGVCRIDRDTTRNKDELENRLASVRDGSTKILVGTQMLAKGHDFPDVTLVGILDTDQALYSADFRAAEHLAQLVIQVAGRAGRASKAGEVKIQTHHPDHPLLQTLLHQGYEAFCEAALEERSAAMLPPFSHMVMMRCDASSSELAFAFMHKAREVLDAITVKDVSVFGPVTAPMERRAGRYRTQIMLQCAERKPLHLLLRTALSRLNQLQEARKVRWSIDIDPIDTY